MIITWDLLLVKADIFSIIRLVYNISITLYLENKCSKQFKSVRDRAYLPTINKNLRYAHLNVSIPEATI